MKLITPFYLPVFMGLILGLSCSQKTNNLMYKRIEIKDNWSFQMEGDSQRYKATVPGSVQMDLLMNNKLPQPFYRENEKQYQWIDKENWIYSTFFHLDSSDFAFQGMFLNFTGLDTYAQVYLNNKQILSADNFYRSWRIDVKDFLIVGNNTLIIKFISPVKTGLKKLEELGFQLPASNDQSEVGGLGDKQVSVFTRKAPYHYGWDWGPRFVTIGIWRPVYLEYSGKAEIRDVFFQQKEVSDKLARLSVHVEVAAYETGQYKLVISNKVTHEQYLERQVNPENTICSEAFEMNLKDPVLWWPNGYGDPYLYTFQVDLMLNKEIIHSKDITIGLRDIKLIREKDNQGQSFYFQVNGIQVFAKGANYIPNDNLLSRVGDEKYTHILKSAYEANMNMLRVWGGGIYENDLFYKLCDKFGILVWQDFMYACSMYPGDADFIDNARSEAVENVKRLRNHACLALWCGNNEIDAAWCQWDENCGWGWKDKYTKKQREYIWKAYDTLFHQVLPGVVEEHSPQTAYWPSSPVADWGKSASYTEKSGDMHYWGVWHGDEPFSKFDEVIPRFMSEYGFQSFPEFNTINEFTLPQDWDIQSDVMLAHQRSSVGNQKIREYMEQYYKVPADFKTFIYIGQLLQAYAISKAIAAHRINKPFCMGSLYWQLNDSWPGASWSGIDYYGNWKALHYMAKEAFKPTRLAALQTSNKLEIYVLNDDVRLHEGILQIDIIDFYGKNLYQNQQSIQFSFDSSSLVSQLDLSNMPDNIDLTKSCLVARLMVRDKLIDETVHYFVIPKNLKLPESAVQFDLKEKAGNYQITLKSPCLEKNIFICLPEVTAKYSDNYFDLLPGQSKTVNVELTRIENNMLNKGIVIQTLNAVNNQN